MDALTLRAMRNELSQNEKLAAALKRVKERGVPVTAIFEKFLQKRASEGYGQAPHQYEEMNKAKWKQTLKDVPVAVLGTAAGYGIGRTASEYLLPHLFGSPQGQETLKKILPAASATASGLGTFMLAHQRRTLRDRRNAASAEQPVPPEADAPKTAGAPAPAVAQATYRDPWRTDRRYKAPTG